jgi:hypothetical protein
VGELDGAGVTPLGTLTLFRAEVWATSQIYGFILLYEKFRLVMYGLGSPWPRCGAKRRRLFEGFHTEILRLGYQVSLCGSLVEELVANQGSQGTRSRRAFTSSAARRRGD